MLGAVLMSPALRRRVGLESPGIVAPAGDRARPVVTAPIAPVTPPEKPKADVVASPVEESKKDAEPAAEKKAPEAGPKSTDVAAKPAPRPAPEPVILSFATPEVPAPPSAQPAGRIGRSTSPRAPTIGWRS